MLNYDYTQEWLFYQITLFVLNNFDYFGQIWI